MVSHSSEWLTLSQACQVLGVHPITLRTWIDQGVIQAYRTAGGHRRLRRGQVQAFLARQETAVPAHKELLQPEQAVREIRREIQTRPVRESAWYAQLSDAQRDEQRQIGQRLIGLLLQYVGRSENAHEFLQEASVLAQEYGSTLKRAGLTASDVARGFLFFRRTIIQATFHPGGTDMQGDADGVRLLERINGFMDELLIATLDAYDAAALPANSKPNEVSAGSHQRRTARPKASAK